MLRRWLLYADVLLFALLGQLLDVGLFEMLSDEDYNTFYKAVCSGARIARAAYDSSDVEESVKLWRSFFKDCDEFPSSHGKPGGFTPRTQESKRVPVGRFG